MSRFDFDKALATWRRSLEHRHVFTPDDLDELEQHLRDQVASLVKNGLSEEAAFERALHEMGGQAAAEREYRKVYWGKIRRRRELAHELAWRGSLLASYLKVAARAFVRQKGYNFIHVAGLAVGIATCGFIFLYVLDEYSYDRYHTHADRIVRVAEDLRSPSETLYQATSAPPMGPALVEEFPEVEAMVRFMPTGGLFRTHDRRFQEDALFYADSTVLDVFSWDLIEGDPESALMDPFTMVLTESAARKYFGDGRALGRTLLDEDDQAFTVTGVISDVPRNSHFRFDGLISFATFEASNPGIQGAWFWNSFYTYLLLEEGADRTRLEAKMAGFIERRVDSGSFSMWYEDLPLVPLTDIHLTSHRMWELEANGNRAYLDIFCVVAIFILLVACINFVNLATARAEDRANEVAVRKVAGARRLQLVGQFLTESFLIALLATLTALGLLTLFMPAFNALTGKSFAITSLLQGGSLPLLAGLVVLLGIAAGGYPALVLSGFRPLHVLKASFQSTVRGASLRKALVVFQFVVSIVLIAGTAVVARQFAYLHDRHLGFAKEQMLVIDHHSDSEVRQHAEAIKESFLSRAGVVGAALSSSTPGSDTYNMFTRVEVAPGDVRDSNLNFYLVDLDFLDAYGMGIVAGRGFSRDHPADTMESIVINEAMVAHFGWTDPEQALGKTFDRGRRKLEVIGVVKNFNYRSLHERVEPLALYVEPGRTRYLTLRLRTDQMDRTLSELERTWQELAPHRPFDAFFLDEYFNRQYRSDERFASIFRYFAGLAVFIACLGLYGLASFNTHRRTKEIGIRKALGASVGSIVAMLSSDVVKLVGVAAVLAVPITHVAMSRWLDTFAYRTDGSLRSAVLAGGVALGIALLTVSYRSIRAALADPVESLRYE